MSDKVTFTIHELVSAHIAAAEALLLDRHGVTASQFEFLAICADVEPTDITSLAQCLRVSRAAVSKRVPAMVAQGWITAHGDPTHGRRVIIELTDRARALVERAGRELEAAFVTVLEDSRARDIDVAELNRQLNVLTAILCEKGFRS